MFDPGESSSSSDGHKQSSRGKRKYMHLCEYTLYGIVLNIVLHLNCDSHSGNGKILSQPWRHCAGEPAIRYLKYSLSLN